MDLAAVDRCLELNRSGKHGIFVRIDRRARGGSNRHFGRGTLLRRNGNRCVIRMMGMDEEVMIEPEHLRLWHVKNVENGVLEPNTDANGNLLPDIETEKPAPPVYYKPAPEPEPVVEPEPSAPVAESADTFPLPPGAETPVEETPQPQPEENTQPEEPVARPQVVDRSTLAVPAKSLADKLREARALVEQVKKEGVEKLTRLHADREEMFKMIDEVEEEIGLLCTELADAGVVVPSNLQKPRSRHLTPGQKAAATRAANEGKIAPAFVDPLARSVQDRILEVMRENEDLWMKAGEIMEAIGMVVEAPSVYLRPLVEAGKIERDGVRGRTRYRWTQNPQVSQSNEVE